MRIDGTNGVALTHVSAFCLPRALIPVRLDSESQDLNDRPLRTAEWSESLREMMSSVFETNVSPADARLNIVVHRLTAGAAIVAVPTAITGYFGQTLMFPGYGTTTGIAISLLLIIGLCAGLWAVFKRKRWL